MPTKTRKKKRSTRRIERIDPTRTVTLRKRFAVELRRRFARLRADIVRLIAIDDVFGVKRRLIVRNMFCPTGEGGGVDPTCGSGETGGGGDSFKIEQTESGRQHARTKFTVDGKEFGFRANQITTEEGELTKEWGIHFGPTNKYNDELGSTMTNDPNVSAIKVLAEVAKRIDTLMRQVKPEILSFEATRGEPSKIKAYDRLAKRIGEHYGYKPTAHNSFDFRHYTLTKITTNDASWQFKTSSEQVKAFQEWLREKFGRHLSIKELMRRFAEEGYKRGIGRAFDDVEKPYAPMDFYTPSKLQFLKSAFGSPVGQERVEQLASRSFDDLKNITSDMSARMSRTLLEGLVDGSHPNEIAKLLSKDLDISQARAETIARTEIIRAHAEGQLDAMQRMGVAEVGVQVEWVTARDDAVCPKCEAMEGMVMEIEQAHNLLPMHPGCRCAWLPAGTVLFPKTVEESALSGYGATVDDVANVFCPTGDGGGVDPTCGEGAMGGGGGDSPSSDAAASANGMGRSGAKITISKDAQEKLKEAFGDKASVEDVAMLAGAQPGAEVKIDMSLGSVDINIRHENYKAFRTIYLEDGELQNVSLEAKSTGEGLGTKIFSQQVAEAAKAGLKVITTTAVRNKHANGYYTWARLGYDGKVPMGQHGGKKISELMKTAEGRAWWKEHGQSFDGTFDLTEGSQSRRVLDAYNKERAARGTTANRGSAGTIGGGRSDPGRDLGRGGYHWIDGAVILDDILNVFCPTGEGGGVDPTCSPGGMPAASFPVEPDFVSSNTTAVASNKTAIAEMKSLATKGDLKGLKEHAGTPSPKVMQYKKELIDAYEQWEAEQPLVAIPVDDDEPQELVGTVVKSNMGGGSPTPPKLIQAPDGTMHVVKVSKDDKTLDHIRNEVDADNAYRAAGFDVPESKMGKWEGKDAKIAAYLDGAKELGEWEKNASEWKKDIVYKEIAKGMAADALFTNWDAVGTGKNNIMIDKDGKPFRIDNGGAFKYRALGEPKKEWNDTVTLKSLQDPALNQNAHIYKSVTDTELHGQIQDLISKKMDILKAVKDPQTRDMLEKRFNHMEHIAQSFAPDTTYHNGDKIGDLLKTKGDKAHTKLYMQKLAAMNPDGIKHGKLSVPISFYSPKPGSKEAALEKLKETTKWLSEKFPGVTVKAVEAYKTAKTLGIKKNYGGGDTFTATQATTAAQETATIPKHLEKYVPHVTDGAKVYEATKSGLPKYTLPNGKDPALKSHEAHIATLNLSQKQAISSWKGGAKDIRIAVSQGPMTAEAKAFMKALESAPKYEGVVYRGINGKYAEEQAQQIIQAGVGGIWSDAAPHCMSPNLSVGLKFAEDQLLLRIITKTGRPIWKEDGFSGDGTSSHAEKEVTGMPNTMYKIMGIAKDIKKGPYGTIKHFITLMEV